jgi:hypothetical protein
MMMKKIKYLLLLWFAITSITVYAQSNKQATKDTAVTFKVHGECIQCKTRIEDALKTKGVKSAIWNIDTKILSLVYNPAQISLDKIENKIVAVGHDVGNKKAKLRYIITCQNAVIIVRMKRKKMKQRLIPQKLFTMIVQQK